MEQESLTLPPLRQDLQLQKTGNSANGEQQWLLYDPLNHAYHALNKRTFYLLSNWQAGATSSLLKRLSTDTHAQYTEDDISTILNFVYQHGLADAPRSGDSNSFFQEREQKQKASTKKLLHSYIFFRIPLIKPHKLLNRFGSVTDIFFTRLFWVFMAVMAVIGLGLVFRQWDQFITTFFGFLSLEGFIGYGIAIILTKIAHEFGHAFAAHRYGCRVTSMGVGLILMFPILYADTTDAWKLKSRRKRLVIGASGMGAEIIIAIFATLAWNIMPDGSIRSITFFLATTSWVMTLVVNLNPFMRFDGYYLLADALDFKNLQPRSNTLGRWWLRKFLFHPNEPCPEELPGNLHRGLIIYALCVWVYRFFLFLGIALLLHGFIIKAVAMVLSIIEIGWFICRPVILEIKEWPALMRQGQGRNKVLTTISFCTLGALFFLPWQSSIKAPALIEPSSEATIFSGLPGQIEEIHVTHGQSVIKGEKLITLRSPALTTEMALTRQRVALMQARVNRQATDAIDRAQIAILTRQLISEKEKLTGLEQLERDMELKAPLNGKIHGLAYGLHKDRWINDQITLMHIRGDAPAITTAYIAEDDLDRIKPGLDARFTGDDPLMKRTDMTVRAIAPAGTTVLDTHILASVYGGAIATRKTDNGDIVPVRGLFRVILDTAFITDRDIRGIVHIRGKRRSPASVVWRRVVAIYNRETGS